jgi:HAD superfamily hydrolase (TIGR01484 family)
MTEWNGKLKDLELVAFDLDGTLAESKSPLDAEMGALLVRLLKEKKVAVASGASIEQFKNQFLSHFSCPENDLTNLYLIPTNGAQLYRFTEKWECVYEKKLTDEEKKRIFDAFEKTFEKTGFMKPEKIYGELIEDRGSQVTFSAYGMLAPLAIKKDWDLDHKKREEMVASLIAYIPDFSIRIGGTSSIDITTTGIDKAFGLNHLMEYLKILPSEVLYVGDALFPGGNDASVFKTGVNTHEVSGLSDTKKLVSDLLENL